MTSPVRGTAPRPRWHREDMGESGALMPCPVCRAPIRLLPVGDDAAIDLHEFVTRHRDCLVLPEPVEAVDVLG